MTYQLPMPHNEELDPTSFVAEQLVQAARSFVGSKWKHRGRSKAGIDCVGLIVLAGKECGLHEYPDDVDYTRTSKGQDLLEPFRRHGVEIRFGPDMGLQNLQDGDILILRDTIFPQHAGIIATNSRGVKTMIHASAYYGRVIEEPLKDEHNKKAITAFRFRFLS